jgi:hypothetical protein
VPPIPIDPALAVEFKNTKAQARRRGLTLDWTSLDADGSDPKTFTLFKPVPGSKHVTESIGEYKDLDEVRAELGKATR